MASSSVKMRHIAAALLLLGGLVTAGCQPRLLPAPPKDVRQLPQDPRAYLSAANDKKRLLPARHQHSQAQDFLEQFFKPWHHDGPLAATHNPFWALEWLQEHTAYGANLRPLSATARQRLQAQTRPQAYPSCNRRAIAVAKVNLRALPRQAPLFRNPQTAGQGFPFDQLQHGTLEAGTPLRITHSSRNGRWLFAETQLLCGWLPRQRIAWVDGNFVQAYQRQKYRICLRDATPLYDTTGIYRCHIGLGALLPQSAQSHQVLIPVANSQRQAIIKKATLAAADSAAFPVPATANQVASLAQRLLGQPYGWGGLYGQRDCSATLRDLFAPFGIWLPRNSANQAQTGRVIDLDNLSPRQKEQRLLAAGVPFFTLVHLPGHIMLYLGRHQQQAVVLHTLWGLRTRPLWGPEGRWLVSQTVITGLQPGREQKTFFMDISLLRRRVDSMNILAPPEGQSSQQH